MKRYAAITIDVEPDCTPTWRYSNPLTFTGVSVGIREILQPLFDEFEAVPTYLINNVVLEDEQSVDVFRHLQGRFELGTHLHSEFIEPHKTVHDYAAAKGEANQCFLDREIEYQKMLNITRLFEKQFSYKPTSFRAGRFSAGTNTIRCLQDLGYLVDTSVTPHVRWKDSTREGVVDCSEAPTYPYFVSGKSIHRPDHEGGILEVPVSIIRGWKNFKRRPIWLRPIMSNTQDHRRIVTELLRENPSEIPVVANMMFHNVEVLPGLSPYAKSDSDVRLYISQLRMFLQMVKEMEFTFVNLSALYNEVGR